MKRIDYYIGTHGLAHSLETILEAAALLNERGCGGSYRFLLLGDGARKAELKAQALRLNLTNVVFVDTVPKDQVVRYWSLLDVSIIHLKATELFTSVIPSKLFECMGMGLPVLHGVAGESAEIVERENVGLVFQPEDALQLANQLERLKADPALQTALRAQGLRAATRYDRSALAQSMLKQIESITSPRL